MDIITNGLRDALGPTAALYALAAMGLNVHFGYTGLLNFGQVGFMLVGAYGLAASVAIFQLPFFVGVLIGFGLSAILALLLGIPTLRLRADYLAITTIAAAEILRFLVRSSSAVDLTAGSFGIPSQFSNGRSFDQTFQNWNPIPPGDYGISTFKFSASALWVLVVAWMIVAIMAFIIASLMRSPWGRVLKSIREDEDAAVSLGKNVFAYKMQSLVLGGLLGGAAGMVLALFQAAIAPDQFLPQITFFAYAIMILGGAATVIGPILGSVIFWFLLSATDTFLRNGDLITGGSVGAVRIALVGVGLMLLMIYRPQGILGSKQEMMLDA